MENKVIKDQDILTGKLIKDKARELGVDLINIAGIERFEGLAVQKHPKTIFPEAKSVIALGVRVPRGLFRGIQEGTQYYQYTLLGVKALSEEMSEVVLMNLSHFIENYGYEASLYREASILRGKDDPGTNPEADKVTRLRHAKAVAEGKAVPEIMLDIKQIAAICGMGEIGLSGQLLTPEFGPFQRVVLIITDAKLQEDADYTGALCDQCGNCQEACPGHAITGERVVDKINGKVFSKNKLDEWQCAVYYRGAGARNNPFMNETVLHGHPEREVILQGEKRFDRKEAEEVLSSLKLLPSTTYDYAACICGRACDIACYKHLEEKKLLTKKFHLKL